MHLHKIKIQQLGAVMLCATFLLSGVGCSPSYPRDDAAKSLEDLCMKEYNLKVQAKVIENTLGVRVLVPGLVDELRKQSGDAAEALDLMPPLDVDGNFEDEAFRFNFLTKRPFYKVDDGKPLDIGFGAPRKEKGEESEAMKILRQVSLCTHRVSLSADSSLEFYMVVARDPGPDRLDVILTGNVMDSKRIAFGMISVSDQQTFRSGFEAKYQPEFIAEQVLAGFLKDIDQQSVQNLLRRYTSPSVRFAEIFPKMLTVASETQGQQQKLLDAEWSSLHIGNDDVLVYIPLYQLGDPGALLFTINTGRLKGGIVDIERLSTSVLPPEYSDFGAPHTWPDYFMFEPISYPDFLADQIAKRVLKQFKAIPPEGVEPTEGEAPAEPAEELVEATADDVAQSIMESAAYVTYSYEYKKFLDVEAEDQLTGTQWRIPATDIPKFKTRKPPELMPLQ